MKTAAVILAGGASRRMGSPKALLTLAGETFLDRLIGIVQPLCSQIIVVLGHDPERIRNGVSRTAEFAVNPDPERGQITSLQTGLHRVSPDIERVFFTPVDYPGIRPETPARLAAEPATSVIIPQYLGKHGHPVLISGLLIPEILELREDESARVVIHRHIENTAYIDVDDPGILLDVDDPEAYRAITQVPL